MIDWLSFLSNLLLLNFQLLVADVLLLLEGMMRRLRRR